MLLNKQIGSQLILGSVVFGSNCILSTNFKFFILLSFLLVIKSASCTGADFIPVEFENKDTTGGKSGVVGTGLFIRTQAGIQLITSKSVRKHMHGKTICRWMCASNENATSKPLEELTSNDDAWRELTKKNLVAVPVSRSANQDIEAHLPDIQKRLGNPEIDYAVGTKLYAVAFPFFTRDELSELRVPVNLVSKPTSFLFNDIDYEGILVFPSFSRCPGKIGRAHV